MKMQFAKWKKIFSRHISDKKLISKICKDLLQLNSKNQITSSKQPLFWFPSPQICFGEGSGTPPQYSCLENSMDGGAWQAAVHGVAKSRTRLSDFTFTHWRREWQPAPVFLPGESQGWGSLVGCRLWGRTELDTTEATQQQQQQQICFACFRTLWKWKQTVHNAFCIEMV